MQFRNVRLLNSPLSKPIHAFIGFPCDTKKLPLSGRTERGRTKPQARPKESGTSQTWRRDKGKTFYDEVFRVAAFLPVFFFVDFFAGDADFLAAFLVDFFAFFNDCFFVDFFTIFLVDFFAVFLAGFFPTFLVAFLADFLVAFLLDFLDAFFLGVG